MTSHRVTLYQCHDDAQNRNVALYQENTITFVDKIDIPMHKIPVTYLACNAIQQWWIYCHVLSMEIRVSVHHIMVVPIFNSILMKLGTKLHFEIRSVLPWNTYSSTATGSWSLVPSVCYLSQPRVLDFRPPLWTSSICSRQRMRFGEHPPVDGYLHKTENRLLVVCSPQSAPVWSNLKITGWSMVAWQHGRLRS